MSLCPRPCPPACNARSVNQCWRYTANHPRNPDLGVLSMNNHDHASTSCPSGYPAGAAADHPAAGGLQHFRPRGSAEPAPGTMEPTEEPVEEPVAEDPTAVVNRNANVHTGPSTDPSVAYWLTVVGRNEAGDWLRIEHEDRPGWIFVALTDTAAEGVAELPADAPPATQTPEPEPEPTPEPETPPAPEPEPSLPAVTVTGSVVNLRQGPGTNHPTAGQVRVTGRNADGSWLQVADPRTAEGRLWIYGPLTDIEVATM